MEVALLSVGYQTLIVLLVTVHLQTIGSVKLKGTGELSFLSVKETPKVKSARARSRITKSMDHMEMVELCLSEVSPIPPALLIGVGSQPIRYMVLMLLEEHYLLAQLMEIQMLLLAIALSETIKFLAITVKEEQYLSWFQTPPAPLANVPS